MRSGSFIQALGRQSFEPSQPPSGTLSGPAALANERQRELIKAQNDVLATVGVCLRDTKRDMEKTENTMAENEVGLAVGVLDLVFTYFSSWPLVGIRNRLQTYRSYEGMRYREVLVLAWRKNSWADLFSGMPAHLCYQLSNLAKDIFHTRFMSWLERRELFRDPVTKEPRHQFWLGFISTSTSLAFWFLVFPLWHHANLQVLHLVPPSPFLPPWGSFIPFSVFSPISLPVLPAAPFLSFATVKALLSQTASSYFLISFVNQTLSTQLRNHLYQPFLSLLPIPNSSSNDTASPLLDIGEGQAGAGEMMAVEIDMTLAADGGGYTATIPFDPVTGEIVAPPAVDASNPLELDDTDIEDNPPPPSPPPQPTAPPPPPPRETDRRRRGRNTTLSSHPANIAAEQAADCITTLALLASDSIMLRTLARGFLRGRGAELMVYRPYEWAGVGLVTRALVYGEWTLMWALFEVSWGISTWVGIKWFGYARHV